ncbi:Pheromone-binding protein-related protein 3, partial [Dufourea novaeangliae]
ADPDDFRKLTASVRAKCIEETKTTLQAIEDTEFGEFPEDDRLKCYFKCVLEKSSMMDKNGKIKYNLLKKIIPDVYKDVVHGMIDSCTEVTAKDHCEKAYGFMKCLYAENPMVSRTKLRSYR